MAIPDSAAVAQLARRLNLVSEDHLQECLGELETRTAPPETLVRVLERKAYLTSWQGAKLLKEDMDGYFLGGYRLLYRIAAGSFGRVFRADDPHSGEIVAVKVLRRRWTEDAHKIQLFEREGKVGLTLKHPNIVQILAVGKDPATGQYYIVMEFVEGGNLKDILNIRKKMSHSEGLKILEEAAAGLTYANSRGLTHRDIKPSNILLSTTGVARLVDFGLAEITGPGDDDDTAVDRTIDYAGLEKATGAKVGDIRSDIYFLGATFFEMITGRPLLTVTRDKTARMFRRRFDVSAELKRDDPDLNPAIYALLTRMVALEPTERFQTPAALFEAVRTVRGELSEANVAKEAAPIGPKTLFVIQPHQKLQDVFRETLRKRGYRILLSIDASRAVQRYQQQPFHGLIIDIGIVGEEGFDPFNRVMREAEMMRLTCAGIVILNPEQAAWKSRVEERPNVAIFIRPVTMKQIVQELRELVPTEEPADDEDGSVTK